MKKHLNTLFVTTQGAYLSKEGETVVVKVEGEIDSVYRSIPSAGSSVLGMSRAALI